VLALRRVSRPRLRISLTSASTYWAGPPDLRFHHLRHTGAVLAAATGATLAELMARLGHSTVSAAMRYQHATADTDKAIAAALGPGDRHVKQRGQGQAQVRYCLTTKWPRPTTDRISPSSRSTTRARSTVPCAMAYSCVSVTPTGRGD